jgi:uncharacterized damage-inducible protein DinB
MASRSIAELLRGQGAHVDPLACVEDLSVELAARPIAGSPHSIQQLVFHMNYWMDYELRRIRGQHPAYPEHSSESFPPPGAVSDANEWNRLLTQFKRLLAQYDALAKSSPEEMQRQIESSRPEDTKTAGTLEAVVWQMVAHNSYHLGQIAMLRRMMGAWPPRAGGVTW